MQVQISVANCTYDEVVDLGKWLASEDELRGRVRTVHRPITGTELGSLAEVLSVALGAGGAGTVLISSLKTWLKTRRTAAKLTVEAAGRTVTLDIQTVDDVTPLLEQILKAEDGD